MTSILKKTSLDIDDLGNYKPISNLTFLSKVLECCIYEQTTVYLQENKLLPDKQSHYRKFHSTETAVLEVLSNVYTAADNGYVYTDFNPCLHRLQSMLRSAARLVLKIPSHASMTVRMRDELHWFGFPHRITFKLCTLAYKCLHGQAPDYLTRSCIPVSTVCGRSCLRSATVGQLLTPSIHTETFGS